MAPTPWLPLLILLPLSLSPSSAVAQNNGTVSEGSSLSTGDTPWLSPSAEFAFGFQPINTSIDTGFLLAIWYNKLPDRTIVWYANRDGLAPPGSKVTLTPNDGLVLTSPRGAPLWTSQMNTRKEASHGFMNDTGNFLIRSRDSEIMWETFGEPTDTVLPTQTIPRGTVLYARRSETNFSKGRFKLAFQDDGNLVLYLQNQDTYTQYGAYYASGTTDSANSSNSGVRWIFNSTGYMYIIKRSGEVFGLTIGRVNPAAGYYHRATLNFDGVFTQYYHRRNVSSSGDGEGWKPEWTKPEDICSSFGSNELGSGACGFNSICSLTDDQRPRCECPPGFPLADKGDAYGNCVLNLAAECAEDGRHPSSELYDFRELPNTNWPQSDYEKLQPFNEQQCRDSCLDDCLCAVVIFGGDACWKKKLPLSNGVRGGAAGGKALIKVRKDGSPPISPIPPEDSTKKDRKGVGLSVEGGN